MRDWKVRGGGPAASSLSQVEIFVINISSGCGGGLGGWRAGGCVVKINMTRTSF